MSYKIIKNGEPQIAKHALYHPVVAVRLTASADHRIKILVTRE